MLIVNNAVDALITVFTTRITIKCGSRLRKFNTYLNHFRQGRTGSRRVYVLIKCQIRFLDVQQWT